MSLLDRLIGDWVLTGEMHIGDEAVPLHQRVEARWILGGNFVEMRITQSDAAEDPYEALYLIGRAGDEIVFHLYDTLGVAREHKVGIGREVGNEMRFVFPYDQGPFTNLFSWDGEAWTHHLTAAGEGEERLFAIKHLRPASAHDAPDA